MRKLLVPAIAVLASVPLIAGERATGQVAEETPTPTASVSVTATPTVGAGTATPTVTTTPTPTETAEPEPTDTVEPEPTATDTPEPEPTDTPEPVEGPPGQDGQDGQDGTPGMDGQDGIDGKDGVTRVVIQSSKHCVIKRTLVVKLPRQYAGVRKVSALVNGRHRTLKVNRQRQVKLVFPGRPRRAVISRRGAPTLVVVPNARCVTR